MPSGVGVSPTVSPAHTVPEGHDEAHCGIIGIALIAGRPSHGSSLGGLNLTIRLFSHPMVVSGNVRVGS